MTIRPLCIYLSLKNLPFLERFDLYFTTVILASILKLSGDPSLTLDGGLTAPSFDL